MCNSGVIWRNMCFYSIGKGGSLPSATCFSSPPGLPLCSGGIEVRHENNKKSRVHSAPSRNFAPHANRCIPPQKHGNSNIYSGDGDHVTPGQRQHARPARTTMKSLLARNKTQVFSMVSRLARSTPLKYTHTCCRLSCALHPLATRERVR